MRIIAGAWRGRALRAPAGQGTRPTADRARQALFDRLMHAPWAGRDWLHGATVLDAFAGTGALGLEALSRGAAHASFIERDRTALATLRANIALCGAVAHCTVLPGDVLHPPPGQPCALVFLDPPYADDALPGAVAALRQAGWITPATLIAAESAAGEPPELGEVLSATRHGAAMVTVFRAG